MKEPYAIMIGHARRCFARGWHSPACLRVHRGGRSMFVGLLSWPNGFVVAFGWLLAGCMPMRIGKLSKRA